MGAVGSGQKSHEGWEGSQPVLKVERELGRWGKHHPGRWQSSGRQCMLPTWWRRLSGPSSPGPGGLCQTRSGVNWVGQSAAQGEECKARWAITEEENQRSHPREGSTQQIQRVGRHEAVCGVHIKGPGTEKFSVIAWIVSPKFISWSPNPNMVTSGDGAFGR